MCEAPRVEERDAADAAFNRRAQDITWALLLIVTGSAFLMPGWALPWAAWLTGVGIIMIGLNAVRHFKGIRPRSNSLTLGGLALAAGLANFAGLDAELPLLAGFLILKGATIVLRPLLRAER